MSTGNAALAGIAQTIFAFDDLLGLIKTGLPRSSPWQRSLADRLVVADERMQVLRMTISMERADVEIQAAASALYSTCRGLAASLNGTRADSTLRGAMQMLADYAQALERRLTVELPATELS